MLWIAFELAINLFEGLILLMYVRQSFSYDRKHPVADALVVLGCAGYLSAFLFQLIEYRPFIDLLVYAFPAAYALALSTEKKLSVVYWLFVMAVIFNIISVVTYPLFSLLPQVLHIRFPAGKTEDFIRIISTNIALYGGLRLVIQIKKDCPPPGASSYAAFILTLSFALLVEESLYALFLSAGDALPLPFFLAYVGLIAFILMTLVLFRIVSADAERKSRYQTEIALLSLTRQHQQELSQMYETLTARQHDYKHHLQALEQLVSGSSATAKAYLDSISREAGDEDIILTGSPEADALLTAKRRTMREKGVEFRLTPYPLACLPIPAADFCAIVGNLLDNAIEGVSRMPAPGGAYIHLSFSRSWDMLYIYCENPCSPSTLVRRKGRFASSKPEAAPGLHGIGLHSIESIALRAEGRAEFAEENGIFRVKVVLPYLAGAQPPHPIR